MARSVSNASIFTPVLVMGSIILMLGFAVRASFGVFQIPIAAEFDWPRSEFSLAIAIQNLAWGIGQPLFGALAERLGDRRAIILGALCYAGGLVLSSFAITPLQHQILEIFVGFGIAGTGFGVILAVVGRASRPEKRSLSLGMMDQKLSVRIGPGATTLTVIPRGASSSAHVRAMPMIPALVAE